MQGDDDRLAGSVFGGFEDPPPPRDIGPTYDPYLVELGVGVYSLHAPDPAFGASNVGLVIEADGLTVIDSGPTPTQGRVFRRVISELTSELELPYRRTILTSSRAPFSGGSTAFTESAVYSSDDTSDELDVPVNPIALRALLPRFGEAYDDTFRSREATHTITTDAWLSPSCRGVVLPGESPGNLVVVVPGADVVFAGALAGFGVTPLGFDADLVAWQASLKTLADLASTVIPGHGPPGGQVDLTDQSDYLAACCRAAAGHELATGPWDAWTDRRFDAVNVERAARLAAGDRSLPESMLRLLGFA